VKAWKEGGEGLCFVLWKEGGDCALFYGRREVTVLCSMEGGRDCALFYGRREGTVLCSMEGGRGLLCSISLNILFLFILVTQH